MVIVILIIFSFVVADEVNSMPGSHINSEFRSFKLSNFMVGALTFLAPVVD